MCARFGCVKISRPRTPVRRPWFLVFVFVGGGGSGLRKVICFGCDGSCDLLGDG